MMAVLTLMSVPWRDKRLYALVPDAPREAMRRLRADDPIWSRPDVYRHWWWLIDGAARLRPTNTIHFKVAA